jgi:RNA polymerase sigma factor (sigma-70 family)
MWTGPLRSVRMAIGCKSYRCPAEGVMDSQSSFADLMARLRTGDDSAASQVFHRFASRLIALARGRLHPRLRQKVDAEDVLQSVFHSFFARYAEGQFALKDWDSLWGLLTSITLRKCARRAEHFQAARRDVRREAPPQSQSSGGVWEAWARDPTPEEATLLTETVRELLDGLEPREREMVALGLQGHTQAEISAKVGWGERTVHRILSRIRKRLERQRDSEDESA